MDQLSPDVLFSQTSDKILSYVFEDATPPPIPAKPTNLHRSKKASSSKTSGYSIPPPLPPKLQPMPLTTSRLIKPLTTRGTRPDSDSDFECNDEIEKIRSSNNNDSKRFDLKKNTMTETARTSERGLTRQYKSCGNLFAESIFSRTDKEYGTSPYRQLGAWHKMLSIRDSSVLTGSLPHLDVINEQDNIVSYVTPNEFKAFVCHVKEESDKISHRASTRVMKRVDSLLKSCYTRTNDQNDYLCLIGTDDGDGLDWLRKSMKATKKAKTQSATVSRSRTNYENHIVTKRVLPKKYSSTSTIPQHNDPSLGDTPSSPLAPPTDDRFDDPVYETLTKPDSSHKTHPQTTKPSIQQQENHASIDYSFAPPTATRVSPSLSIKPYLADIQLGKRNSELHEERPPASLPKRTKPIPPPKPRMKGTNVDANSKELSSPEYESVAPIGVRSHAAPVSLIVNNNIIFLTVS